MAKISVTEKDLSWFYRQRQRGNLVVYSPGLSTFGPGYDLKTETNDGPVYVTKDTFKSIFGDAIAIKNEYSFYIVESLLRSGIDVYFHRIIASDAAKASSTAGKYEVTIKNKKTPVYRVTVTIPSGEQNIVIGDYTFHAGQTETIDFPVDMKETVDTALSDLGEGYTVVKEDVSNDLVITINGTEYVFPSNTAETGTTIDFDIADKAAVDTALTSAGVGTDSDYEKTAREVTMALSAKYKGSFGNNISVLVKAPSADSATRYIYVYAKGALVESLIVNFDDPLSKYYYENVESNYISFEFDGEFEAEMLPEGNYTFSNGGDGTQPKDDAITTMADANALSGGIYSELSDPYGFSFDIIINGDLSVESTEESTQDPYGEDGINYKVDMNLSELAKKTGTAIYLISGGKSQSAEEFRTYCGHFGVDGNSWTAGIGPWAYAELVSNGVSAWLPGYYPFLVAWGNSISKGNPVWYAPAGVQRARLGSTVRKLMYPVGSAILDAWQNQDYVTSNVGGYKVNPLMNVKQYGYCVYGNSTLLHSKADGSTSMLQSLGTRVLVNQIKIKAFEVALGLQFDQLTDNLFMSFKVQMGAYMDQLKYQGGLYDYEILIDRESVTFADLNQRRVPVKIRISPNPAAEIFDILCEVYPAGVDFTDEFDESLYPLA